jgi:hypothetical protein
VLFSIHSRRAAQSRHVTKTPSPQLLYFPHLQNGDARNPFRFRSYVNSRVPSLFPDIPTFKRSKAWTPLIPINPLAATPIDLCVNVKCCEQKTYGLTKPFSCNTYKKLEGATPSSCILERIDSACTDHVGADQPGYLQRSVVLDALKVRDYSSTSSPRSFMRFAGKYPSLRIVRFALPIIPCVFLAPPPALCQDSGGEGTVLRGNRAEISLTVRDSSGEPIAAPASVNIFKEGVPTDQTEASHGRAFFILRSLGDYTIVVNATGYKTAQRKCPCVWA